RRRRCKCFCAACVNRTSSRRQMRAAKDNNNRRMQLIEHRLRRLNELLGRAVAWLALPMVLGTFAVVVLRYVFSLGWIWMQEAVMWMHAALFLLATAYTLN